MPAQNGFLILIWEKAVCFTPTFSISAPEFPVILKKFPARNFLRDQYRSIHMYQVEMKAAGYGSRLGRRGTDGEGTRAGGKYLR